MKNSTDLIYWYLILEQLTAHASNAKILYSEN